MRLWVDFLFGPDSNFVFDVYYVFFTSSPTSCQVVAVWWLWPVSENVA